MSKEEKDRIYEVIEFKDVAFWIWTCPRLHSTVITIMERKKGHFYDTEIKIRISSEDFKKLVNNLNEIMEKQIELEKKLIEQDQGDEYGGRNSV